MRTFEFRRRDGSAVYRFDPEPGTTPRWKRTDLDLWCVRLEDRGWAVINADEERLGWPLGATDSLDVPPEGAWLSVKDEKIYIYDLAFIADTR